VEVRATTAKVGVRVTGAVVVGAAGTSLEDSPAATGHVAIDVAEAGLAATVAGHSSGWIPAKPGG
jgi:hypothetical protein